MLVVPFKALDVTQIQIAKTDAPASMVIGQPDQPIGHFVIFSIELALVSIARPADAKRFADDSYANASFHDRFLDHLPSARWPDHFFSSASRS